MAQDGVQDWSHAAKVFTAEDLIRSPKFKGMFHVTFVFNPEALSAVPEASNFEKQIASPQSRDVLSVLTKSIDLPRFNIQYTTHNQYNKTTHTYKKIKYEPVNVTFHDDHSDIIWAFWAFYYNWYFADGTKYRVKKDSGAKNSLGAAFKALKDKVVNSVKSIFKKKLGLSNNSSSAGADPLRPESDWDLLAKYPLLMNSLLSNSEDAGLLNDAWGLNGAVFHAADSEKSLHLLKQIEIYPLGLKQASMIVLHNPRIVSWDHDTFDYSATETATCKMQLVYEGVSYMDQISAAQILQDVSFYDKHASPLMRGTPRSLLGEGGVLDRAGGIIGNILSGKAGIGDIISAVGIAKSLSKKSFKVGAGTELKKAVGAAIEASAVSAINNQTFPSPMSTPTNIARGTGSTVTGQTGGTANGEPIPFLPEG